MSRTVFQFAANSYHMRTGNPTLKNVFYFVEDVGRVLKENVHTFPFSSKSDGELNNAMVFPFVKKRRIYDNVEHTKAEATVCHLISNIILFL